MPHAAGAVSDADVVLIQGVHSWLAKTSMLYKLNAKAMVIKTWNLHEAWAHTRHRRTCTHSAAVAVNCQRTRDRRSWRAGTFDGCGVPRLQQAQARRGRAAALELRTGKPSVRRAQAAAPGRPHHSW